MTDIADKVCDLECVKKAPPRHEFIGPVKIILVEPLPEDYSRKSWGSGCLTLAMLIMGAVVFTVFSFTLTFRLKFPENVHIFLCTMGYQLFLPSGILMVNNLFGGAVHLRIADRKCQHFLLQVCAIGCGATGSVIIFLLGHAEHPFTVHGITGLVAAGCLLMASLIGPTVYFTLPHSCFGKVIRYIHTFFALPGFIAGMVCFVMGLLKKSFIVWEPIKYLHYILIALSVIYASSILLSVYLRHRLTHQ